MSITSRSPDPVSPSVPEPVSSANTTTLQTATFAGGCFWGVEDAFRHLPGVVATRVGYTGGRTAHPTYRDVCSHTTGHAEAVEVVFDPARVSYEDLVSAFLVDIHDPTQLNRQGPDLGDQYRSAIYVRDAGQRETAERILRGLAEQSRSRHPIVTEVTDAPRFWEAEEYHQQYFEKQGGGACHLPMGGRWMGA
ncbi:MAG: peptide-methionine (S)-S-oxide reductase MsrA [Candidatus Dormibacteria bacterium]